ncbi:hypothetical protein C2845_PM12G09060 [Panicum miliaceum]|uniref:Uncharacterized protein n=1 Tax=Panicum miliaceum TaxID=4540 RepID=A0A3L6QKA1_PANMI|nr:hypothetical protein C2845_PM12G09060 [Panicum miliaceum]
MARRLLISLDAGSSLPRNLRARHLCRLLRQQLAELLRAPVRRPRRGKGRGAGFAGRGPRSLPSGFASRGGRCCDDGAAARRATRAASSDSSTLATRRGPPVMLDTCTTPKRILVESPRHCKSHGWTARVRLQPDGLPQEVPDIVTSYCPRHGWMNYARHDTGSSSTKHGFAMASPRRAISPSPSPDYMPATSLYTPTPAEPPEFLLRGTIATRRGTPPFYMATGSSNSMAAAAPPGFAEPEPVLAPPSPPPAPWFSGRPTAAAVANARPGLRCIIKTGHVPSEMSAGGEARRPPPSGEG